jgi:hypothetical protein
LDNKDNIFDLLSSKVSETETLTENDWLKIDQKYTKSLFYKWSFNRMNIYYTSLIAITFAGTIYILANYFKQNDSTELNSSIYQKHQVRRPNDYSINHQKLEIPTRNKSIIKQNISAPSQENLSPSHTKTIKKEKNSDLRQKEINNPLDKKDINTSKITQQTKSDSNDTPFIEEKAIELPKKIKLPVIIYQQDTIFDIDSTKVSRRKISKMNN